MILIKLILFSFGTVFGENTNNSNPVPKMNIAYLKWDFAVTEGIEGTNKLVQHWTKGFRAAKIDTMMFPVGPGKIMLMSTDTKSLKHARKFILEQKEIDFYAGKEKNFYPTGRNTPLTSEAELEKMGKELNMTDGIDLSMFESLMTNVGNDEL